MSSMPECATDDQLIAHVPGAAGKAAESISRHLAGCESCRARLETLSGERSKEKTRPPESAGPDKSLSGLTGLSGDQPGGVPATNLPAELANHPDYINIRELGRGGMGIVYLAQHRLLKRSEVLKILSKKHIARKGAVERFVQEMQAAASLSHPNVVKAYNASMLGEMIVFSMEYAPGNDLAKVVKTRGPLGVAHASFYAAQVALGLQHASDRGMVHRDIKPANLILTRDGKKQLVKILDFGLAKITSEETEDTSLTREGQIMGTPDYMSPEQSVDASRADIRADLYSLGCTLYFLLAGRPPFKGKSLTDLLLKHQSEVAKPLNLERPEVPAELAAIVAKLMSKKPADRYQTPAEVAQALKPFFGAVPVTAPSTRSGPPPLPAPAKQGPSAASTSATDISSATAIEPPPLPEFTPPAPGLEFDQTMADPEETTKRAGGKKLALLATVGALALLLFGLTGAWMAGAFKSSAPTIPYVAPPTPKVQPGEEIKTLPTKVETPQKKESKPESPEVIYSWKHVVQKQAPTTFSLRSDGVILGPAGNERGTWELNNSGRTLILRWPQNNKKKNETFVDTLTSPNGVNFSGRSNKGAVVSGVLSKN